MGYWGDVTIEEAIQRTQFEAKELEQRIIRVSHAGLTTGIENLSGLFRPLQNFTIRLRGFEKSKLSGFTRNSWLRLYAVRVDVNLFVVAGSAIKLTRTMNSRQHLLTELRKLDVVCAHLQSGEVDRLGLYELI